MSVENIVCGSLVFISIILLGEPEFKVCENKIDGVCPLHNLQCQYPECEE
jgi:hypothetical protein